MAAQATWVAVGIHTMGAKKVPVSELIPEAIKVLGPFDTADEARAACNFLGVPLHWTVVPMMEMRATP